TPMFAAVDASDAGLWLGQSATDAVVRYHAFRRIPGLDLVVIVGLDQRDVLVPVAAWQQQARLYAGIISGLTAITAILVLSGLRGRRRWGAAGADSGANLAASQALAEVSRIHADAIERRLHATFAAVADGVSIFDAHLNLVEWNEAFPERSGVDGNLIHPGMAMEEVLRSQAEAGYFGEIKDVEAEVDRRIALLRAGNFGASLSFQTAARVIELRCRPLADGGFVALYTDVTEARQVRQALCDTRAALGREQSSRRRLLEVIAFELNVRRAALVRSIDRLRGIDVPTSMLEPLRGVGKDLAGLAIDATELPRMEASTLVLQPALIELRPLLRDVVDEIRPAARDFGITVYQVVDEDVPTELVADANRIRQIAGVLLHEALRIAEPDTMWLLADGGGDDCKGAIALRLTIRGFGTPIPEEIQDAMFPALRDVAVPANSDTTPGRFPGTGFGPAIARHLTALMGGQLSCETWSAIDGRTGNDFILTLPSDLLPGQRGRGPGLATAEGKPLPRTRILLVGATTGLRMAAKTMLQRDGHMVDTVATNDAALQAMRQVPYDIAFIDSVLPDASAEGALASIRDLAGPARILPVILLAQPHDNADESPWRESGADDVLAANPTLEDFSNTIRRHVWLSMSFKIEPGSSTDPVDDYEEGIPILSAERIMELRANLPRDELLDMV
ncbi:MAG TPA: PAS-domain containing protein, partial [Acetobacteraceae bacterium]|nr:PAS-domain containing protein [Acetobacteraceae bacterium]